MKTRLIIIFALVAVSFGIALYFYPRLPNDIVTHWDTQGAVNGASSKFLGVFFIPFIITGMAILFLIIPIIDPLRSNIEEFRLYYDGIFIALFLFLIFAQVHLISWNLGVHISPNRLIPIGAGLLFYYLGIVCEHIKQNWFIGVRTPWTLSSPTVWAKTHKLAATLFKLSGILAFLGTQFPEYALYFILVPILSAAAYTIFYSYNEYKKETRA